MQKYLIITILTTAVVFITLAVSAKLMQVSVAVTVQSSPSLSIMTCIDERKTLKSFALAKATFKDLAADYSMELNRIKGMKPKDLVWPINRVPQPVVVEIIFYTPAGIPHKTIHCYKADGWLSKKKFTNTKYII